MVAATLCLTVLLIPPPVVTLRVLAYNIRHGEGMDRRVDLERTARVIRRLDPDLVALQEVDSGVERTGRVLQALRLGQLTGLEAVFGSFMEYQGGHYGMALLSRHPITAHQNHCLPGGTEPRSALEARIDVPGLEQELILVGVHLYRTSEERMAQARQLVQLYSAIDLPMVLAGDFNSELGSAVMDQIEAHWRLPSKQGPAETYPSSAPDREIDFIAFRPQAGFKVLEYRVIDELQASDHRPVLMVVGWDQ